MPQSSGASDEMLVTHLNMHQAVRLVNNNTSNTTNNNNNNNNNSNNYDGLSVDCVASGYATYDHLRIKVRKGANCVMCLGCTKEVDRRVTPMSCVHSDYVVGDPSSLSDTRLKPNQQIVP